VGTSLSQAVTDPEVWRNRNFLLLWLAQAISQTAQNAIWYGIVVLVESRTRSSTQLSVAVLTLIVPSVIFGVLAGVYVDRWDKRMVLISTNLLRGLVALAYAFFGGNEALPMVLLLVVNFVFSTIGQFFAPAEAAMIPAIVPRRRLLQANGLFHLTFTASQLLGLVVLGPLLAKVVGLTWLFGGMALLIVACAALAWPLPPHRGKPTSIGPATEQEAVASVWKDVRAVGRFVVRDRIVSLSMVQWTIGAILGLVVATLVPSFGQRLLRVSPEDAVFIMAPAGIGMVLGTAFLNRWGNRFDKHFLCNLGLWTVTACLVGLGVMALVVEWLTGGSPPLILMPWLGEVSVLVPFVMIVALIAGLGFVAIMVTSQTYLQERAPVDLRGRVFAVLLMLSNLASIVPLLVLGGVADLIGVEKSLILVGSLIGTAATVSVIMAPGTPPWRGSPESTADSPA
jgi:MFS family permease